MSWEVFAGLAYIYVLTWGCVRYAWPLFRDGEEVDFVDAMGPAAEISAVAVYSGMVYFAFYSVLFEISGEWIDWSRFGVAPRLLAGMLGVWLALWYLARQKIQHSKHKRTR